MKKSKITLIGLLLIIVLITIMSSLQAANPFATDDGNVVVTEGDLDLAYWTNDGVLRGKVTVDSGDSFTVTLYAYLGAGMRWSAIVEDTSIVRSEGHELIYDKPWPYIGGPGKEAWTFKAVNAGVTTITMTYGSLGLTGPPNANTLKLVVDVKEG